MPTYDYKCKECGHLFEVFQNITADPVNTCPECGGAVKRLLGTGAGIIFKGSGFYATDYRSSGYQSAAAKDTSSAVVSNPAKQPATATGTKPVAAATPAASSSSDK
ncbi:MAG: zinc ribbon domain-containing protein [Spartobacteria bacterium]|nr:zinc ribbon domain-containing protein [Spartobacteria bacterium]